MHQVRQRGWIIPAYKLPKNIDYIHILRVVIREIHSEDMVESLVRDILWAYETLRDSPQHLIKESLEAGMSGEN